MEAELTAAERWARDLAAWAIPPEILESAPRRPYVFLPEMFAAPEPGTFELSLSNRRASEALDGGGSVLDVGCGGGAAAFAVAPPATEVIGTDRQSDMLDQFAATARARGVAASVHAGSWPEIAAAVPAADVVVCHNVLYNAADIAGFVAALSDHARRRVVIEITPKHPQDRRRALWRHFWNLDRPHEPTAATAAEAIRESGIAVNAEESTLPADRFANRPQHLEAAYWCRQLCLPPDRQPECEVLIAETPFTPNRTTLWWDTKNH